MICSNCESSEFVCGGCGVNLQPADAYTASEVKVLTETAGEAGRRIGWKAAGEEIATALEQIPMLPPELQSDMDRGVEKALDKAARIARRIASQPSQAVLEPLSGAPGHRKVSSEPQAARNRLPRRCPECGDVHVMGCPDCGADLDMRGHYPNCPQEVSEAVRSPQEPCDDPDCPIVLMHSHPEGNTP